MRKSNDFIDSVRIRPAQVNLRQEGQIELATNNLDGHMNVYARSHGQTVCVCMVPDDARAVRDLFLAAYPLPSTPSAKRKSDQRYVGSENETWESLHGASGMERLRVPGGWLYRPTTGDRSCATFVPMPAVVKHKV